MKNIFYLFLMLTLFVQCKTKDPVASAPFKWYSFEEAQALNTNGEKVYFVDIYTDWCGWCKRMDKATFAVDSVQNYLKQNFIPIKFNAEQAQPVHFAGKEYTFNPNAGRKGSHDLARMMLGGRMSYPSYAFVDGKGNIVGVVKGYKTPDKFMPELKNMLAKTK